MTIQRTPSTRGIALTTIALVGALTLAGCTPSSETAAEPTAPSVTQPTTAPTQTAEPAPEPAEPVEDAAAGDVIDAQWAAELNDSWAKATDPRAYELPDGTHVYVEGNAPLPEVVKEAVTAAVVPTGVQAGSSSGDDPAAQIAFNDARAAQEAATGRTLVTVLHALNAVPGGTSVAKWTVGNPTSGYSGDSREEAILFAQAWVDKSPGTRAMIVVDALS